MDKVIFTQRVEVVESYGERRDCADQRIAEFIQTCGFLPIPVPNNKAVIADLVKEINPVGIVLTGGNSLVKYGGNAIERDETDCELIRLAVEQNISLYGFCRGMQSILDYFEETLSNVNNHVAIHHNTVGEIEESVNSYHNQACLKLRDNTVFDILAKTEDGVIEAIRHKQYKIIGTMWHPERENPFKDSDILRVKELFI